MMFEKQECCFTRAANFASSRKKNIDAQFCYSGVVFRKQKQALFSKTFICGNDSRTIFVCLFFRLCVCLFRFEQSTVKLKILAFDRGNEINNFVKVNKVSKL